MLIHLKSNWTIYCLPFSEAVLNPDPPKEEQQMHEALSTSLPVSAEIQPTARRLPRWNSPSNNEVIIESDVNNYYLPVRLLPSLLLLDATTSDSPESTLPAICAQPREIFFPGLSSLCNTQRIESDGGWEGAVEMSTRMLSLSNEIDSSRRFCICGKLVLHRPSRATHYKRGL